MTGEPEEGTARVETSHTFSDHRPAAYTAVLTVSAMSDAGRVSGSDSFSVQVTESPGFLVLGWNFGGTAKGAIRALLAIVSVATRIIIWVAILSPVIIVVGAAIYLLNRYGQRLSRPRYRRWPPPPPPGPMEGEPPATDEEPSAAGEEAPGMEEAPAAGEEAPASEEEPSADGEPPAR